MVYENDHQIEVLKLNCQLQAPIHKHDTEFKANYKATTTSLDIWCSSTALPPLVSCCGCGVALLLPDCNGVEALYADAAPTELISFSHWPLEAPAGVAEDSTTPTNGVKTISARS